MMAWFNEKAYSEQQLKAEKAKADENVRESMQGNL